METEMEKAIELLVDGFSFGIKLNFRICAVDLIYYLSIRVRFLMKFLQAAVKAVVNSLPVHGAVSSLFFS